MTIEHVKNYLAQWNRENDIIEFNASTATVQLAAEALGTEPERIAKTLSFRNGEGAQLIVVAGDAKIDNRKFKQHFNRRARMLSFEKVPELTGHEVGGVCPFAVPDDVPVYLDISLKRFKTVFPACGTSHSAIEVSVAELETYTKNPDWIDVCKDWDNV